MLTFLQHSVVLMIAALLAIGPAYCQTQCQAAAGASEVHQASCCHSETKSHSSESSRTPPGRCACEVHPKAIDGRGSQQWGIVTMAVVPAPYQFAFAPWLPVVGLRMAVPDIPLPVSLHVLKCVWRC